MRSVGTDFQLSPAVWILLGILTLGTCYAQETPVEVRVLPGGDGRTSQVEISILDLPAGLTREGPESPLESRLRRSVTRDHKTTSTLSRTRSNDRNTTSRLEALLLENLSREETSVKPVARDIASLLETRIVAQAKPAPTPAPVPA
ncbi:hypothetical protein HQ520_12255, partial [bacterium]|nr:hypothetical protein [bacterium]